MRPSLLFLAHRIPYPPHKGEKLRAYHLLRALAERYDVYLGALIDDPEDWEHRDALDDLCAAVHMGDIRGRDRRIAGVRALRRGQPATYSYFHQDTLARWVADQSLARRFDAAFVYSSGVAPYLNALATRPGAVLLDFVDVDSAKWEALGNEKSGPMAWIYRREAQLLAAEETRLAQDVDASIFVTEAEAALFRARSGVTQRVYVVENGVDLDYWEPARRLRSPYPADGAKRVVFTGAMDYLPNIDAVLWFADHALPLLRKRRPDVEFVIAGGNPAPEVEALAKRPGVRVTGRVEDMRPYLGSSSVAVAPLQIARGVQNKVLEAMAAGVPVVASPFALEGIRANPNEHLFVEETPEGFAARVDALMGDRALSAEIAYHAQSLMRDHYGWAARAEALHALIDQTRARLSAA